MKTLCLLLTVVALALFTAGCVHLPSAENLFSPAVTEAARNVASSATAKPATVTSAIQHTFNYFAVACILGGLVSVGLGAYSIYRGLILSGIKFILGGILLPVAGIYVAYHWLLITALALIGAGVYLTIHYWAVVSPVLAKIESDITPLLEKAGVSATSASKVTTAVEAGTATAAKVATPVVAAAAAASAVKSVA
jgi:hypothetical protein